MKKHVESLDPRVNRLPLIGKAGEIELKAPLDQFGTFEVFVQPKDGKPFQHEGIVHAPNLEMAYVLAKEAFTRRFVCVSLYVVDTRDVYVSPLSEADVSAYSLLEPSADTTNHLQAQYEIYHLAKRGKQHIHFTTVQAASPIDAMMQAKAKHPSEKIVYNIWAIPTNKIRFTSAEEQDLWLTLPEKKFRDASDYKGGDKLKAFLERT